MRVETAERLAVCIIAVVANRAIRIVVVQVLDEPVHATDFLDLVNLFVTLVHKILENRATSTKTCFRENWIDLALPGRAEAEQLTARERSALMLGSPGLHVMEARHCGIGNREHLGILACECGIRPGNRHRSFPETFGKTFAQACKNRGRLVDLNRLVHHLFRFRLAVHIVVNGHQ